jgi:Holliday junction resolvase
MANWEKLEQRIANITGGKITPGSGNKQIKGDVIVNNYMIECKYTEKDNISIKHEWFRKLEKFRTSKDLCLVIGLGPEIFPYFFIRTHNKNLEWENIKVNNTNLPKEIETNNGVWELGNTEDLKNL